jgi:hypothetical protein
MIAQACKRTTNLQSLARVRQAEQLEAHVQAFLNGRVRDLRVVIAASGIILQGRAHTYYAKQLAQHAVMEVLRQPILANDIEVC